MKVGELISKLKRVDPEMIVYVRAESEPCAGCNIQVVSFADDVWVHDDNYGGQLYIGQANGGTETL